MHGGAFLGKLKFLLKMFLVNFVKSEVFANGPRYQGSIPGLVIQNTQKMVLSAALLSTQHYKVQIKDKVDQFREWSSTLP